MDVGFNTKKGSTVVLFDPVESDRLAILMQLVLEEEWRKGVNVPDLNEDFFRQLAVSKNKFRVEFDFQYLEFLVTFLTEVCHDMEKRDVDTEAISHFIEDIMQWRFGEWNTDYRVLH